MTTASRSLTTALLRGALARGLLRRVTPPAGTRPLALLSWDLANDCDNLYAWTIKHSTCVIFWPPKRRKTRRSGSKVGYAHDEIRKRAFPSSICQTDLRFTQFRWS